MPVRPWSDGPISMSFFKRLMTPGYAILALFFSGIILLACNSMQNNLSAREEGAQRFLSMHKKFVKQGRSDRIELLFLGDSITEYWLTEGKKTWNSQFSNWEKGNFGIAGDTTHGVLWRINNGELDNLDPEAVILLIGTNDISIGMETPEQIAKHIGEIVSITRKKLPESKVLLLGIFPRGHAPDNLARPIVKDINERIARLDDGKNVRYLDISDKFLNADGSISPEVMPDFLHLSARGYEIWAESIKKTLKQMLG